MKYLLDTNTVIYFFKGMGQVAEHLLAKQAEQLAISSVTLYELKVGILKSNNPNKRIDQLERLLRFIAVIPFDAACAHHTAVIRASLEQAGTPIGPYDLQIAGTAIAHQYILVTHNTKEFARISGIMLDDWF